MGDTASQSGLSQVEPLAGLAPFGTSIPIAIGTTLYVYDPNRRHYENGRIVFRKSFKPVLIIGETRKSWIAGEGLAETKISKSDLTINHGKWGKLRAHTAAQMEDEVWRHDNKYRIERALQACQDVAVLRAIDVLLAQGIEAAMPARRDSGSTCESPVHGVDAPK